MTIVKQTSYGQFSIISMFNRKHWLLCV